MRSAARAKRFKPCTASLPNSGVRQMRIRQGMNHGGNAPVLNNTMRRNRSALASAALLSEETRFPAMRAYNVLAGPADADAGFTITIGSYGSGGYFGGSSWYGHGYWPGRTYGGWGWYGRGHDYRPYRRHCRWKVKRVKVRYWDAYSYRWQTRKVHRRIRVCR